MNWPGWSENYRLEAEKLQTAKDRNETKAAQKEVAAGNRHADAEKRSGSVHEPTADSYGDCRFKIFPRKSVSFRQV